MPPRPLSALLVLLAFLAVPVRADDAPQGTPENPLRLFTVGNSFAVNATRYLPDFARAGGHGIVILNAYKGGCSLQEHATALAAAETAPESPAARIYAHRTVEESGKSEGGRFNLVEGLQREKWDVVTIQQYSAVSYKPESYEPYASQIVAAIRKYAPQAEIAVHETWSYRADDPLFASGKLTPDLMYAGLRAAYAKLAAAYGLRTIPVGDAFELARSLPAMAVVPDPSFDFANAQPGSLPQESGGLNMGWGWKKDVATGAPALRLDAHHANKAGQYVAAAVFYESLFGDDVEKNPFCPPEFSPEIAAALRHAAHEAVRAAKAASAPVTAAAN